VIARKVGLTVLGTVLLTAACGQDDAPPRASTEVQDIQSPGEGRAVDSYLDYGEDWVEPASYVGEQVRLAAQVGRVISPRAFTLAGADSEPLLVVHSGTAEPKAEQVVLVVGTVRNAFSAGQVEQIAPQTPARLFADWEAEPYLLAESVAADPETG
jgi:hypothetical protein